MIDSAAIDVYDVDDIAIDSSGTLYGVAGNSGGGGGDRLVIIDKQTGSVQLSAPILDGEGQPTQDVEGLARYSNRYFFGTTGIEFGQSGTDNSLYRIEKKTGTADFIIRLDGVTMATSLMISRPLSAILSAGKL